MGTAKKGKTLREHPSLSAEDVAIVYVYVRVSPVGSGSHGPINDILIEASSANSTGNSALRDSIPSFSVQHFPNRSINIELVVCVLPGRDDSDSPVRTLSDLGSFAVDSNPNRTLLIELE